MNPWITKIFATVKRATYIKVIRSFPGAFELLTYFLPKSLVQARLDHELFVRGKVLRRKDKEPAYTDFMTHLLQAESKGALDLEDLCASAGVFIIAGSETTAALLSGATYYLLQNPGALAKLTHEVRSSFASDAEITFAHVTELDYMLACLNESLRLYPPVPGALGRITPPEGAIINGRFVPGNVSLMPSDMA